MSCTAMFDAPARAAVGFGAAGCTTQSVRLYTLVYEIGPGVSSTAFNASRIRGAGREYSSRAICCHSAGGHEYTQSALPKVAPWFVPAMDTKSSTTPRRAGHH